MQPSVSRSRPERGLQIARTHCVSSPARHTTERVSTHEALLAKGGTRTHRSGSYGLLSPGPANGCEDAGSDGAASCRFDFALKDGIARCCLQASPLSFVTSTLLSPVAVGTFVFQVETQKFLNECLPPERLT